MPLDKNELNKIAQDHAWNWFALHAGQRMQAFNFFLVATTFLVAGYASVFEKHPGIAAFVSAIGAWIAFWFTQLDRRTCELIEAGESVLKITQARLAEQAGVAELQILDKVERHKYGVSYRLVIAAIEWVAVAGFLLAAGYATRSAICSG